MENASKLEHLKVRRLIPNLSCSVNGTKQEMADYVEGFKATS
jgi:hypothetical protein